MSKVITYKDPLASENMLVTLASYPDDQDALDCLKAQGYTCSLVQIANKRLSSKQKIEELRERIAPEREAIAANNMLDIASAATELQQLSIRECLRRMQENHFRYSPEVLARIAREISQVAAQNVDKRLALQGRPTEIRETRNVDELVNALVGLKVATVDGSAVEIPEATEVDG